MGTSGTESCEGCLWTQFKHLPPQLVIKLSLVRLYISHLIKQEYFIGSPSSRPRETCHSRTCTYRSEMYGLCANHTEAGFSGNTIV